LASASSPALEGRNDSEEVIRRKKLVGEVSPLFFLPPMLRNPRSCPNVFDFCGCGGDEYSGSGEPSGEGVARRPSFEFLLFNE
jgi:hypothetical protein